MCYEIVWNREVVDEADSRQEAEQLAEEYEMTLDGPVSIRHRSTRLNKMREQD